jgi:hypothetical protein
MMGAFDGVKVPYDSGYPICDCENTHRFFSNYCFSFFKGFGEGELRALLKEAEESNRDTVWVPAEHSGKIGLHAWYVRALLDHHFDVQQCK